MKQIEFSIQEVANELGKTVQTIHRWIKTGRIQNVRRYGPKFFRIPKEEVDRLISNQGRVALLQGARHDIETLLTTAIEREHCDVVRELWIAYRLVQGAPTPEQCAIIGRCLAYAFIDDSEVYAAASSLIGFFNSLAIAR